MKNIKGRLVCTFITLIGVGLLLHPVVSLLLGVYGSQASAVITNIRRELGERGEVVPNRYTYIVSYTFTTTDGQTVSDYSRKIGDAIYIKASGQSRTPVRYFAFCPLFNTMERDTQFNWGKIVMFMAGVLLIIAVNRPEVSRMKRIKAK